MAFHLQAGVVLNSLHSFGVSTNGTSPSGPLLEGGDGNFYGMAGGGTGNSGVIFSIGTNGALTILHTFAGGIEGANPKGGLVPGGDGYFYGTTFGGGANGYGTVFKINASGAFTSLYSFTGVDDSEGPSAGLVLGSDGNFYGTTSGESYAVGTVFRISASGAFSNLYTFTGGFDGYEPYAPLIQGSDGSFYGTTAGGGTNGQGTIFKISASGAFTSLYSFTGGYDGSQSFAPLIQGGDGNFYGTTQIGGFGDGVVFKISPSGSFSNLYSFNGISDGEWPRAGLAIGSDGNFYGTTWYGGAYGYGTVFKISTNGALTTLYHFTSLSDGGNPSVALVQGSDGYFYGTTVYGGGTNSHGTIFKISADGALTTLYHFLQSNDGGSPWAGLVQGTNGNFYGTTTHASVFEISASGAFTNLYSFTGGNDGFVPYAPLIQGSDGNFYGTTENGGTNGYGTVFKIDSSGAFTSLYSFTGSNDGVQPFGSLVQGSDSDFYGTTAGGGTNGGGGTVFKISAGGSLTSLYSFTGSNDGAAPFAGLVLGSDANFYGTTVGGGTNGYGTVFKISASGSFTSLHSFTNYLDGANPHAPLVQGRDGIFYGTTQSGGANALGTVFKISASGSFNVLHSFIGTDGGSPNAPLVQGSDGNFYGTAPSGAANMNKYGTIFAISPSGSFTNLYFFTGGIDGAWPYMAGLVQGSNGNFYGTTWSGGMGGNGTVFQLLMGPVANPVIQTADANFGVRTNRFGFDFTGTSGSVVVIEASTNLANPLWIPLATNTLNGNASYFSDPQWTNYGTRFYRLRTH